MTAADRPQSSANRWSFTGRKPHQKPANGGSSPQSPAGPLARVLAGQSRSSQVRPDTGRLSAQRQGVAGSNPVSPTDVMSQDMPDTRTCGSRFGCLSFRGVLGLVVLAGIDDGVADELAGGGVDDADVEVLDEQDHAGAGVGSADADVA